MSSRFSLELVELRVNSESAPLGIPHFSHGAFRDKGAMLDLLNASEATVQTSTTCLSCAVSMLAGIATVDCSGIGPHVAGDK